MSKNLPGLGWAFNTVLSERLVESISINSFGFGQR